MTQVLKNDQLELNVLPQWGCYWKTLNYFFQGSWRNLLEPMPDQTPPFHFGSYIMAPWSNRIPKGIFVFNGKKYQVRINFPDDTAIHGDVRYRAWTVEKTTPTRLLATLDSSTYSDFNYPFKLKMTHEIVLKDHSISMSLHIENKDSEEAPVGFGFHPFFKRRLTEKDQDAMVVLNAAKVYPDVKCIPTGPAEPVKDRTDLRTKKLLGNPNLDHCYTDLKSQVMKLVYPGSGVELRYEADPIFTHAVIYAPQDQNGQPRDFVALEPVTHVNNGFNLYAQDEPGTGIKVLKPGERWGGKCVLSVLPFLE